MENKMIWLNRKFFDSLTGLSVVKSQFDPKTDQCGAGKAGCNQTGILPAGKAAGNGVAGKHQNGLIQKADRGYVQHQR